MNMMQVSPHARNNKRFTILGAQTVPGHRWDLEEVEVKARRNVAAPRDPGDAWHGV